MTNRLTKEELDLYLQEIGGLENGFKAKKIFDSHFFSIGEGWYNIVKNLIADLIELGWNREVCQVKEKLGQLRFYIGEGSQQMFDRIQAAEEQSLKVCEISGDAGQLRTDIGWYRTLSEIEYLKIKNGN
jgi:hypothetical protein